MRRNACIFHAAEYADKICMEQLYSATSLDIPSWPGRRGAVNNQPMGDEALRLVRRKGKYGSCMSGR